MQKSKCPHNKTTTKTKYLSWIKQLLVNWKYCMVKRFIYKCSMLCAVACAPILEPHTGCTRMPQQLLPHGGSLPEWCLTAIVHMACTYVSGGNMWMCLLPPEVSSWSSKAIATLLVNQVGWHFPYGVEADINCV